MVNISVEDRLAIQELTFRYAMYVDTQKVDDLVALYAETGTFDQTRLKMPAARGHSELRKVYSDGFKDYSTAHHITNHLVNESSGSRVKGTCFVYAAVRVRASGALWHVNAYYDDDYVKVDGRWRFQARTIMPLLDQ